MIHRFLLCMFLITLAVAAVASAQPAPSNHDRTGESWDWSFGADDSGGSSYLGVDIADVSPERLGELKLKEEHGAEVTMVDEDAPAGKAGLHEHDVIVSLNGAAVESAAQLRRMIKETPPGRIVTLGISRDGQPLTIKVQLADRQKSLGWGQKGDDFELGKLRERLDDLRALPDFDLPVSVVVVHSSMRSGLMVENISPQLGDFFGVKDGKGVLVRSVDKGSRGEKAGFRAGDVVVKVNNQPVHDTSDFSHALRSSPGGAAAVTVMRDKKEQNLTLTLPEKKDSGSLLENGFDMPNFTAATEQAINRAGEQLAALGPATLEKARQAMAQAQQALGWQEEDAGKKLQDSLRTLQQQRQRMQDRMRDMQDRQQKLRHDFSGAWADI
ncbi:MAG: PDZ domain-containing protein [Terriglobales bacterium]|jgi:membrane-associated protease RseP (regulator of RpoE activity)